MKYSTGEQNIITDDFQMIRLSEGYCPHKCPWCYEWKEAIPKQDYTLPLIVRRDVRLSDMNILASHDPLSKINQFRSIKVSGKVVYPWLICGIDYRFLTKEIAIALKYNRFIKIHIAWDKGIDHKDKIESAIYMLLDAGYNSKDISVFMICNHPSISFNECMEKFYICHSLKVKVNDCYFDNQFGRKPKIPIGWTENEMTAFRKLIRKHNQILNFGIDPERQVDIDRMCF
jgi:hypothetical protein